MSSSLEHALLLLIAAAGAAPALLLVIASLATLRKVGGAAGVCIGLGGLLFAAGAADLLASMAAFAFSTVERFAAFSRWSGMLELVCDYLGAALLGLGLLLLPKQASARA